MHKKLKNLKPGQPAPTSGQYQQIRSRGGKFREYTVVQGQPLPPHPDKGGIYHLVDPTKNRKSKPSRPDRGSSRKSIKATNRDDGGFEIEVALAAKAIEITLDFPENATDDEIKAAVADIATGASRFHRSVGGSGLEIRDVRVEKQSLVPAEVK